METAARTETFSCDRHRSVYLWNATSLTTPSPITNLTNDISANMTNSMHDSIDRQPSFQLTSSTNNPLPPHPPLQPPPTKPTTRSPRPHDFILLHKNTRGLCKDDAVDELLTELQHSHWHVIALNETWRKQPRELWTTQQHHVFAGSGHDSNSRGVGFLIHKSITSNIQNFHGVDERIAYIDIHIRTTKLRIITAYFPHSGYGDTSVQRMYDALSTILHEARTQGLHPILTGDFNAQVGKRDDNDTTTTRGKFALEPCNSRGEWLTSWASSQHLILTNTYFDKTQDNIVTYYSPSQQPRQIDYILTDTTLWRLTRDAHSTNCPDLGSDHNAVRIRLDFSTKSLTTRTTIPSHTRRTTNWPPDDYNHFRSALNDELSTITKSTDVNAYYHHITSALIRSTQHSAQVPQRQSPNHVHNDDQLQQLIHRRRHLPPNSPQRKQISHAIRKRLQRIRRRNNDMKIEQIIEQRQGLRHITDTKRHHANTLIASMTTSANETTTNRQSIADVFATFYEDLYRHRPTTGSNIHFDHNNNNGDVIDPFSTQELDKAINQLRSGKCRDTTGLLAEMLKNRGHTLRSHLLQLFNDVLSPNATPPAEWKHTTISVIFKSGDAQLPNNYRPIAIIPLLYKLFARLLYNRLEPHLDKYQPPDQAGFRHNYSTDDHLFTTTIIHERSHEWQLPLWVSAVDFKKAFDTIDHQRLWQALHNQDVPPQYIRLLQSLYSDQSAAVKTDKLSRHFHIQRGVKQGDPLSSLLFNSLLEDIFSVLKRRWTQRHNGIQLGHQRQSPHQATIRRRCAPFCNDTSTTHYYAQRPSRGCWSLRSRVTPGQNRNTVQSQHTSRTTSD